MQMSGFLVKPYVLDVQFLSLKTKPLVFSLRFVGLVLKNQEKSQTTGDFIPDRSKFLRMKIRNRRDPRSRYVGKI